MDILLYLKLRRGEHLQAKNFRALVFYAFRGGCSQVFWKTKIDEYPMERHGYFHHFTSCLSQKTGQIVQNAIFANFNSL
jgi:hypothetical protein